MFSAKTIPRRLGEGFSFKDQVIQVILRRMALYKFPLFPYFPPGDLGASLTQSEDIIHRRDVSFEHVSENVFSNFHALAWSVRNELMHMQDCATSFFHSVWFGKKNCYNPRARLVRVRKFFASAKSECVLYTSAGALLRPTVRKNHIMTLRTVRKSLLRRHNPGAFFRNPFWSHPPWKISKSH